MPFGPGQTSVLWPKEPFIRWGPDTPTERGTFEGTCTGPIVTYLRMSAFRTVRLLPPANVPAQLTRRTNPFAAARGDKTAMRGLLPNYFGHLLELTTPLGLDQYKNSISGKFRRSL